MKRKLILLAVTAALTDVQVDAVPKQAKIMEPQMQVQTQVQMKAQIQPRISAKRKQRRLPLQMPV